MSYYLKISTLFMLPTILWLIQNICLVIQMTKMYFSHTFGLWTWLLAHSSWNPCNFLFSSAAESCPTLCDPMDCSTPGFPVGHQLSELAQTHVHRVGDAIQPSHPLLSPSPPAFDLSQYQDLFQWVGSSHQVAKVLEFQLQHESLQWIFSTHLP